MGVPNNSDLASSVLRQNVDDFLTELDGKPLQAVEAAHEHHAHSGHSDHHGAEHHMMKMWFHGGYEEVILFEFWRISTPLGLLLSCLAIFIMGIAYEALKWSRVHLQTRLTRSVTPVNRRSALQFLLPGLYVIQLVLAYWLMLIAMTYNYYLTAAVVLGGGVGHWIFAIVDPTQSAADELAADSCH
ncbi:unnamed protein product, partial [Mesorhabditis spiculigera]